MPLRGHLGMPEDFFGCHKFGSAIGIKQGEARDAAKRPPIPRTAACVQTDGSRMLTRLDSGKWDVLGQPAGECWFKAQQLSL